jgi:hypothetical protein
MPKKGTKLNLTEEERAARRERMLAIRQNYAGKKPKEQGEEYVVEEEPLPEDTDADEVFEFEMEAPQPPVRKPVAPQPAYQSKPKPRPQAQTGGYDQQFKQIDAKFNKLFEHLARPQPPVNVNVHAPPEPKKEDKDPEFEKLKQKTFFRWD